MACWTSCLIARAWLRTFRKFNAARAHLRPAPHAVRRSRGRPGWVSTFFHAHTHTNNAQRTRSPNPDYFSHALYQRLVAGTALLANVTLPAGAPRVRAWAACAARAAGGAAGGVTIVFANFDAAPAPIALALAGGAPLGDLRYEYVLTAGDAAAGLASKTLALNGAILAMGAQLSLPLMPPVVAPASAPLVLPPQSYGFVVLPEAAAPACSAAL